VALTPEGAGATARLDAGEVVVELALPDVRPDGAITVPWAVFTGPAGAAGFTAARRGAGVEVRWAGGDGEASEVFPAVPAAPPPARSAEWLDNPPALLAAVAAAAGTAADHPARYALHRVLLRGGRRGEVVGTDGKALLVWGGFAFPWAGDALVPAVKLAADGKPDVVRVGRTGTHVVLEAGGLTVWLGTDPTGRYPDPMSVVPADGAVRGWCRLDPTIRRPCRPPSTGCPGGGRRTPR
jgi:hypothetical protein